MGKFGYDFYFKIGEEVLTLPITPSSLNMKIGSNNKVVTLIDEGDINILKSPSLVEFEFDARFPMRSYPYSREALNFETYMNKFTALKTDKTPFVFNVVRTTPDGKGTWGTVRRVTLEDLEIEENADEGDDVIVSFNLKEYKDYGVRTLNSPKSEPSTTSTSEQPRNNDNKSSKPATYIVKPGDCLWNIAKAAYGDGSKWTAIYEHNKQIIDSTAEKYRGKGKGSSNGHWIYAGTELIIPGISDAKLTVQKVENKKEAKTEQPTVGGTSKITATIPRGFESYVLVSIVHGEGASRSTATGYSTIVSATTKIGNTVKLNIKLRDEKYRYKFSYWMINGVPAIGSEGKLSYTFKATEKSYNCVAKFE